MKIFDRVLLLMTEPGIEFLQRKEQRFVFPFQTSGNLNYGTNWAIIFYFLVNKTNKFYGAMMD